jgi:hypothetical protein
MTRVELFRVSASDPTMFSNSKTQQRTISANESSGEMILRFRSSPSWHPKWISCIGTLLETDTVLLDTHFGFACPYRSPVEDNLMEVKLPHPLSSWSSTSWSMFACMLAETSIWHHAKTMFDKRHTIFRLFKSILFLLSVTSSCLY